MTRDRGDTTLMAAFSIIAVGEVHSGHPLGGCPLGTLAQDVGGAGVHGISGSVYVIIYFTEARQNSCNTPGPLSPSRSWWTHPCRRLAREIKIRGLSKQVDHEVTSSHKIVQRYKTKTLHYIAW